MTCTFFGHRIVPNEIEPTLRSTLIDLIDNHDVDLFYVGNHGGFDAMVHKVLKELSAIYAIPLRLCTSPASFNASLIASLVY